MLTLKFDEAYNKMPGLLETLKRSKPVRSGGAWQKNKSDLPKKGGASSTRRGRPCTSATPITCRHGPKDMELPAEPSIAQPSPSSF